LRKNPNRTPQFHLHFSIPNYLLFSVAVILQALPLCLRHRVVGVGCAVGLLGSGTARDES
jgi:hypothetical protein